MQNLVFTEQKVKPITNGIKIERCIARPGSVSSNKIMCCHAFAYTFFTGKECGLRRNKQKGYSARAAAVREGLMRADTEEKTCLFTAQS